jgi:hypothetical protein
MNTLLKKPEIYFSFKNKEFVLRELSLSMNLEIFLEKDSLIEFIILFKLTKPEFFRIIAIILREKYRNIDMLVIDLNPINHRFNDENEIISIDNLGDFEFSNFIQVNPRPIIPRFRANTYDRIISKLNLKEKNKILDTLGQF